MSGFVSFVSSGPGDPELLTVRAVKRLETAEVVLFDDLSAGPILEHANPEADLIGVGKRAGCASPKQHHVSQVLVDHAAAGLRVVRLKSGDSGLFGRLEEEILALRSAEIPFEIVPGVTSASAAAATAGLPLTRRLTARRVQFITGADVTGGLPEDANMEALADPLATTVVYMGKRTFPTLAARLLEAGLSAETPAMLAEAVSTPAERIRRMTLSELAAHLESTTSSTPALILYGPLASVEA
ncbi:MAG: uroporphyrinogen-III C-methyltransferase [Pseudomonadota bacterium]